MCVEYNAPPSRNQITSPPCLCARGCAPRFSLLLRGKVIDEQIDEEKLVVQFRERLTNRLEELGLGQIGLASAFEEVDVAGHGELTIKELRDVLFALNFHAPKVISSLSTGCFWESGSDLGENDHVHNTTLTSRVAEMK